MHLRLTARTTMVGCFSYEQAFQHVKLPNIGYLFHRSMRIDAATITPDIQGFRYRDYLWDYL